MKSLGSPKTIGELRALIADLPDAMPLHRRGNMGDYPPGLTLVTRKLAPHKHETSYFADVETDPVWSRHASRKGFGEAVDTLCTL